MNKTLKKRMKRIIRKGGTSNNFSEFDINVNGKISKKKIIDHFLKKGMNIDELSFFSSLINKNSNITKNNYNSYLNKYKKSSKRSSNLTDYFKDATKERFSTSIINNDKASTAYKILYTRLAGGDNKVKNIIKYLINHKYPSEKYNKKSGLILITGLSFLNNFYNSNKYIWRKSELVFYKKDLLDNLKYYKTEKLNLDQGETILTSRTKVPPACLALNLLRLIKHTLDNDNIEFLFNNVGFHDNINIFVIDLLFEICNDNLIIDYFSNKEETKFLIEKIITHEMPYIRIRGLYMLLKYLNNKVLKEIAVLKLSVYSEILFDILKQDKNLSFKVPIYNDYGIYITDETNSAIPGEIASNLLCEMLKEPDFFEKMSKNKKIFENHKNFGDKNIYFTKVYLCLINRGKYVSYNNKTKPPPFLIL